MHEEPIGTCTPLRRVARIVSFHGEAKVRVSSQRRHKEGILRGRWQRQRGRYRETRTIVLSGYDIMGFKCKVRRTRICCNHTETGLERHGVDHDDMFSYVLKRITAAECWSSLQVRIVTVRCTFVREWAYEYAYECECECECATQHQKPKRISNGGDSLWSRWPDVCQGSNSACPQILRDWMMTSCAGQLCYCRLVAGPTLCPEIRQRRLYG